jgi:hypothetical protein
MILFEIRSLRGTRNGPRRRRPPGPASERSAERGQSDHERGDREFAGETPHATGYGKRDSQRETGSLPGQFVLYQFSLCSRTQGSSCRRSLWCVLTTRWSRLDCMQRRYAGNEPRRNAAAKNLRGPDAHTPSVCTSRCESPSADRRARSRVPRSPWGGRRLAAGNRYFAGLFVPLAPASLPHDVGQCRRGVWKRAIGRRPEEGGMTWPRSLARPRAHRSTSRPSRVITCRSTTRQRIPRRP